MITIHLGSLKKALIAASLACLIPIVAIARNPTLVVGHKSPDTDAIASAIAAAYLKTASGIPAEARAQGLPNPETRYVLQRFGFKPPPIQHSYAGYDVILVDHSDEPLAPDDINRSRVVGIFDHHKLGGIRTSEPVEVIMKPWGSTATILHDAFVQSNVAIPVNLAGLMLSAVLSDTRTFASPTTTEHDHRVARSLAKIAGIEDIALLGKEMLNAHNAEMIKLDDRTLVSLDLKVFKMGRYQIAVSQIEAQDTSFLEPRMSGLKDATTMIQREKNLDGFVLMVTDIQRGGSRLLAMGPLRLELMNALRIDDQPNGAWRQGIFSRKLQIIPSLETALSK